MLDHRIFMFLKDKKIIKCKLNGRNTIPTDFAMVVGDALSCTSFAAGHWTGSSFFKSHFLYGFQADQQYSR